MMLLSLASLERRYYNMDTKQIDKDLKVQLLRLSLGDPDIKHEDKLKTAKLWWSDFVNKEVS